MCSLDHMLLAVSGICDVFIRPYVTCERPSRDSASSVPTEPRVHGPLSTRGMGRHGTRVTTGKRTLGTDCWVSAR